MINPNQFQFDFDSTDQVPVHSGQMSLEYDDHIKTVPTVPVRYPAVEIGSRALHFDNTIKSEMDYSRMNGLVLKREKDGYSTREIDRLVDIRNSYGHKADDEFCLAWGSVDELTRAGFDEEQVLVAREKDKADFDSLIDPANRKGGASVEQKNRARRLDKFRKRMKKIVAESCDQGQIT